MPIKFDNTYSKLPADFYQKVQPVRVINPKLLYFNFKLADSLGIDPHFSQDRTKLAEIFSGNELPDNAEPIALAYAGHQFGYFVPQLGDGRAVLLGEIIGKNSQRFDLQLKGSGITAYSRNGDGRAALGPMLREYIVSEAMHILEIKTTRSLAVVSTGENVLRNGDLLPGAILARVAASHIRIGTFEYFAARLQVKSLKILADYTINRHYPQIKDEPRPYISLFEHVRDAQIDLIVNWLRVGFVHGVMNTDNVSISGETLDYGPCAFIDEYDPHKVFSAVDYYGSYRFANQANVCYWNLIQFAKCLRFLIDDDLEKAADLLYPSLVEFKRLYESKYLTMMGKKIGIIKPNTSDKLLIEELLELMHKEQADYTLTFRYLSHILSNQGFDYSNLFILPERMEKWLVKWRMRLSSEQTSPQERFEMMLRANPAIIPRNHQVEAAIKAAVEVKEYTKVNALLQALSDPYNSEHEKHNIDYMRAPKPNERVYQTFCGT